MFLQRLQQWRSLSEVRRTVGWVPPAVAWPQTQPCTERIQAPWAPVLGMQLHTRVLLHSASSSQTRFTGELYYRARRVNVFLVFPCVFGFPPAASVQGNQPPEKRPPGSTLPPGLEVEFTQCGKQASCRGEESQQSSLCVQAFIWKDLGSFYNWRAPDLVRSPILQSRG